MLVVRLHTAGGAQGLVFCELDPVPRFPPDTLFSHRIFLHPQIRNQPPLPPLLFHRLLSLPSALHPPAPPRSTRRLALDQPSIHNVFKLDCRFWPLLATTVSPSHTAHLYVCGPRSLVLRTVDGIITKERESGREGERERLLSSALHRT